MNRNSSSDLSQNSSYSGVMQRLAEWCSATPVRMALATAPFGGAVDVGLQQIHQDSIEKKRRQFLDEVSAGSIALTEEVIESEDFVYCFMRCLEGVTRSHDQAKVKRFAKLLTGCVTNQFYSMDDFDRLLRFVDQLGADEIMVLRVLEEYETRHYHPDGSPIDPNFDFEGKLLSLVQATFPEHFGTITDGDLKSIVMRLNQTGCYGLFGLRNGPPHDCKLTPEYFRLKRLCLEESRTTPDDQS